MTTPVTRLLHSKNPADGSLVGLVPDHGENEVREAVSRAREAAAWWRATGFAGRAQALRAWRRELWRDDDSIVELVHKENGKPRDDALIELALTLEHIRWAQRNAARVLRRRSVSPGLLLANFAASVSYQPVGVVGVIGPWNYPLYAPNGAVAYALAAGNVVLLKPSEHTPAVSMAYAEAFRRANPHVPDGVLQVVTGGAATGSALCRSGVDKVSFTGSTRTGRQVMAACATTLTPVVLECGGKDAAIIAADADLPAAAAAVAWGAFTNAGQTCVGVERAYVHRDVAEEFLALLLQQVSALRPGSDDAASYGPMTMPAQAETVRQHVTAAIAAGGRLLAGKPDPVRGRLVDPVVILDAPEDCPAVREETFGPTLTVRLVDDLDEAIALANDHPYGLAAAVFSRRHARQISDRLQVGQVCLNSVIAFAGMGALPMGGTRASGFGRLHGADGLREFTHTRSCAAQRFAIPAFDLMRLRRPAHLIPTVRRLLALRHGARRPRPPWTPSPTPFNPRRTP